ncbi:MAG TPA: hypothetical protein VF331_22755 [Polyangiales bacterium]
MAPGRRPIHLARVAATLTLLGPLLLMAAATSAAAQAPVHATIVQIDADEVVIDVGGARLDGVRALTVYRGLEVRHPVTHALLRDRFAIGVLRVVQPGDSLSIAKLVNTPSHPLRVGDAVEAETPPPSAATSPAPAPVSDAQAEQPIRAQTANPIPTAHATEGQAQSATTAANAATVLERELLAYWNASLSRPPDRRIRVYLAYLERRPDSPYRSYVEGEIAYLRTLEARLHATAGTQPPAAPPYARIEMAPISGALAGSEVELAALVRGDSRFRAVILHVRPLDAAGYRSVPMSLDSRGHTRARVPAELVRTPGFAYFLETVDDHGEGMAAFGSASAPKLALVRGPVAAPAAHGLAVRVRYSSEIASFDGTSGRDYFLVNEGDFLYRLRRGALYGVRVGYGDLRGEGGTVQRLDVDKLAPQPAGFSYGFFEVELALHRLFGAAMRATVGLGRPDNPSSQRNGITGGFQLRARIGEADGTHLVLAGELMPEIGQRAYIGLAWEAIERVPMSTEIVVTDQPVNSNELAVRLIYEIGYRFTDRVSIALRPSYQLRTIRHAGPGIGMAATFDW